MTNLIEFQLFSEWRNRTIYGESFADALTRQKTLQRPDKFADGKKIAEGERISILTVHGELDTSTSNRGGKPYISALVETGEQIPGEFVAIDAVALPVKFHKLKIAAGMR